MMYLKPAFPQIPGGFFIGILGGHRNSFYIVATLITLAKRKNTYHIIVFGFKSAPF